VLELRDKLLTPWALAVYDKIHLGAHALDCPIRHVPGVDNYADALTKPVSQGPLVSLMVDGSTVTAAPPPPPISLDPPASLLPAVDAVSDDDATSTPPPHGASRASPAADRPEPLLVAPSPASPPRHGIAPSARPAPLASRAVPSPSALAPSSARTPRHAHALPPARHGAVTRAQTGALPGGPKNYRALAGLGGRRG
jgi:hypothetical protein